MGKIGEVLPKVVMAIYKKSILELEILYLKSLGIQNIFVNSFFYTKELKEALKEFLPRLNDVQVTLVEEEKELDIGGAVHNLASKLKYQGNLLILNSDQFLMLDDRFLKIRHKT